MNRIRGIAYIIVIFSIGQAQALICNMTYSFPCRNGSLASPALHATAEVSCTTGTPTTSYSLVTAQRCEVDYGRNNSVFSATYKCEELGWQAQIFTNGLYKVAYLSTGGGWVSNYCNNGQPRIVQF